MERKTMELITEPANELLFTGPFNHVITTHLKLMNPSDRKKIFKIKTTAPKYYCVRPNGGLLLPQEEIKVQVMLQPFDAATEDRTKDKFMVQSAVIPADKENLVSPDEYPAHLWNEILPSDIKNQKLKCVFFPSLLSEEPITSAVMSSSSVNESVPKAKPTVSETEVKQNTSDSEEVKKLHDEYKVLKAEINNLLKENSMLKEESMRSRTAYSARSTMQEPEATNANSGSQENTPLTQMPIYLVVSVLILLLGVYIGKNVL